MADERIDNTTDAPMELLVDVAPPEETVPTVPELVQTDDPTPFEEQPTLDQAGLLFRLSDHHETHRKRHESAEREAMMAGFAKLTLWFNHMGFSEADRCQVDGRVEKAAIVRDKLAEYMTAKKSRSYVDLTIKLARHEKMIAAMGSGEKRWGPEGFQKWTYDGILKAFAALKLRRRQDIIDLVSGKVRLTGRERLVDEVARKIEPSDDEQFMKDVRARREATAAMTKDLTATLE